MSRNYVRHDWEDRELIAEVLLDNIEDGVELISSKVNHAIDNFAPIDVANEIIEARTNYYGKEYNSLKERMIGDQIELCQDASMMKKISNSDEESTFIKGTTKSSILDMYVKGKTYNGKSVGEDEGHLIISSNNKLSGDNYEESIKEIILPKGGLKIK